MNKIVLPLLACVAGLFLYSCNAKKDWDEKKILKLEQHVIDSEKSGKLDTTGLSELLTGIETFADKHPGDSVSAKLLFKAADWYRYTHRPLRSINIYEKIFNDFPNSEKRPLALF